MTNLTLLSFTIFPIAFQLLLYAMGILKLNCDSQPSLEGRRDGREEKEKGFFKKTVI